MKRDAKAVFEQTLDEEKLLVEQATSNGDLWVGNRRGLDLAKCLRGIDEISSLKNRIASFEVKNALLEDRVSSLTSSLGSYPLMRNRFISAFKRDKLGNATETDMKIIGAGNAWAHGGDAAVDTTLYQGQGSEKRRDATVYERLYGIDPLRVLSINYKPTIDVLNVHAGVAASKHKISSAGFYAKFAEFIKLLEESDYDESYLDDGGTTGVTRAYWPFLPCVKDEVTMVDGDG